MELTNFSQIRALLERHGFRFSKSLGQNFLTEAWVPRRIAEASGADKGAGVLEVGPGIGCLTEQLSLRAGKVVAIELDQALRPVLAETLAGRENVRVLFGDALRMDLRALAETELAGLLPVVCANLPYNVTTPLLTAFLEAGCFSTVTVMIQKEVARRLCAGAGSGDYGAFTVFVNWHAEPEYLFDVAPGCFVPRPKVTSAVVRLTRRTAPPAEVCSEKAFFRVVRAAFGQRRKTLANALSAGLGDRDKETVLAAMARCGLPERARGETLDIPAFAALTDALYAAGNAEEKSKKLEKNS